MVLYMPIQMTRREKQLRKIKDKRCRNVKVEELCSLVESYGFRIDRVKGSHYIYKRPGYEGIITIPHHGSDVQPRICKQAINAIQEVIECYDE